MNHNPSLRQFPSDDELAEMGRTDDVPAEWTADCDNCRWFLANYARSDLYLFTSVWGGKHVNNRHDAVMVGDGS
jgi:hypothetical protein